jgi:hypothetical protein
MRAFSVLLVPLKVTDSPAYATNAVTKDARRKQIAILCFIDYHLTCPMLEEGKSGSLVR